MKLDHLTMTIAGRPVATDRSIPVTDPATGEVVATAPDCSPAELESAVRAARDAWPSWRADEVARRTALLECAALLAANARTIGEVITAEQGKPLGEARHEVLFGIRWFEYYADLPLPVETAQDDESAHVEVRRQSLGPVAAIIPWNFPVGTSCMKLAPALLAGNTVVLKPSPCTPLSMLLVGDLLRPVLPPGVLNVVSGGDRLGAAMASHPLVRKVSFTGSVTGGQRVAESAAPDLKRLTLELGGNDPAFVLDDVDPATVAGPILERALRNCGQVCNAPKRIYAHSSLVAALTEALADAASRLRVGPGSAADTDLGPVSNQQQHERIASLVREALTAGAVAVTGGAPLDRPGHFYPPTILSRARAGLRVVDEEQFGPVLPVIGYSNLEDVVAEANATHFGLGASIWTRDMELAERLAGQIEAGTVWINSHAELHPHIPMAGVKWSGLGVEHGTWGLESYLDMKVRWRRRKAL